MFFVEILLLSLALHSIHAAKDHERMLECLRKCGRDLAKLNWNYGTSNEQGIKMICKKWETMAIAIGTYGKYLEAMNSENDILRLLSVRPLIRFSPNSDPADICEAIGKIIGINQKIILKNKKINWDILGQANFENEAQWKLVNSLGQEYETMKYFELEMKEWEVEKYSKLLETMEQKIVKLKAIKHYIVKDEIKQSKTKLNKVHDFIIGKVDEFVQKIGNKKERDQIMTELLNNRVIREEDQRSIQEKLMKKNGQKEIMEYLETLKEKDKSEMKENLGQIDQFQAKVEGISFKKEEKLIGMIRKYINKRERNVGELRSVLEQIREHLHNDESFEFEELNREMYEYWQRAQSMQGEPKFEPTLDYLDDPTEA